MEHTRYRPDIDGLRALAVLSVLLYHVDVAAFSGGYVGVDIFFVISGFLITRLIRDEVLQTGTFSFANFYLRRARRLLPSFFFTLVLCLIAAFFLFPPLQMQKFGGSLFYSIISLANVHFWGQSGYFDAAAVYKPLLHIWSLSVEEQFYLVWPLLLVFLLLKMPKRAAPAALIFGFGVSLYLNFVFDDGQIAFLTKFFPTAAGWFAEGAASIFYLTPFRAFEFAIGALLVWLIKRQPQNARWLEPLMFGGLALILYSIFTYTETTLFPSYNALAPCLGTALLIYSGGDSRYGGRLLRLPFLVEIGKISYSLYLIHWPAIIFYKYYIYDFGALSALEQILISVAALLAARFTYVYIEQPFRKSAGEKKTIPTRAFLAAHVALGIVLAALALSASNQSGWEWRAPAPLSLSAINEGEARKYLLVNDACFILGLKSPKCKPDAPLQVLTLGDSHSYVGYNMFSGSFHDSQNVNLVDFGSINNCSFAIKEDKLKTLNARGVDCQKRADALNKPSFYNNLDVVVISAHKLFLRNTGFSVVAYLKSKNKDLQVVIIGSYIDLIPYRCADIINRFGDSAFCKDARFVNYFGNNEEREIYYDGYLQYNPLYIDMVDLLCPQGRLENCQTEANGSPMFYDDNHLSLDFSLFMGRKMLAAYSTELAEIGFPVAEK